MRALLMLMVWGLVVAAPAIPGAARALERLVERFHADEQSETRRLLADNLLGVLSQVLVRRKDGAGRVAAHELLLSNGDLVAALKEGDFRQIGPILGTGKSAGMQSLDDSLDSLLRGGVITPEDALRKAVEKSRFAAQR